MAGHIESEKVTLTVPTAATSVSATTTKVFSGRLVKVEIDPGAAMSTSATLKAYQATTALATSTRDHYLNYTFPASEVELVVYPLVATTTSDGSTATNPLHYVQHAVDGPITCDLASATAADACVVEFFVES